MSRAYRLFRASPISNGRLCPRGNGGGDHLGLHTAAGKADWVLPIKPGTDTALLLAWMNVIINPKDYSYILQYIIMIKIDHHIHGTPWNNSWAGFRRAVWHGWKAGCQYIGVAEHGPRFNHRVPYRSLYLYELDRYFNTLQEIRLEFQEACQVLTGLELDYNAGMLEPYRELLPKLPLDFVTGSLHTVKDWVIDLDHSLEESELRGMTTMELYQEYFSAVQSAVKSGLFDFIAHPDFIKKGLGKSRLPKPPNLSKIYRETAEILAVYQVGVEINTRGALLPEVGEFYPDELLLRECFRAEVPFTVSSDTHQPEIVASGLEEAMALAYNIGYRQISVWKNRERMSLDL